MKVSKRRLHYIKEDSTAYIKTKGLLGDALVEISIGTKGKAVSPGGFVVGITPKGLSDFLKEANLIVSSLKRSLFSIEDILRQYRDPTLSKSLKGIAVSIDKILNRIRSGPGPLHALIYSRELSRNIQLLVRNIRLITKNIALTTAHLELLLRRSQRPGTLLHSLALSKREGQKITAELKTILKNLKGVSRELNFLLSSSKKPGTLIYKALVDKTSGKIITNLLRSTEHLKTIMADIRAGKGTIGALINDPTAFEDLKIILGQVKRSRIFRALIRFIIRRNDQPDPGKIVK